MPDFDIRPAAADDLPTITAIYAHAVRTGTATFELDPPDLAEMTSRFLKLKHGGFPYLVAAQNSAVLGYAYAGPYRPRPAYRFTVENSVYFTPEAQRRGMGIVLLNELIAQSTQSGFRQMIAVIGDSANAGSIAVHTRAGFELIGIHRNVGFKFGRWLDTVMMQRALGDGGTIAPVERS
ncbi:MAG: GCN5 family acetyltransferase [Proteobacteria bacterium SG_bin9]|nr:MAG: GCN5 family acetyltransferase [Proteobacteria bacterium SG_bin9]